MSACSDPSVTWWSFMMGVSHLLPLDPDASFQEHIFQAPLCQATLHEGPSRSVMRLLKTASEMRLLRHRSASLRDLPSASFLR
jgi:hypothetical protein